jgi:hypothetical protein
MRTSSTRLDDVLFDIHDIATLHHGFVNSNNHSSEDPISQLTSWLRFFISIKVHKLSILVIRCGIQISSFRIV